MFDFQSESDNLQIKICGITNLEDALLCQSADPRVKALGFIFAKSSPRFVEPKLCQKIVIELEPRMDKVGVFVNEELETLCEIASSCGLSSIQLHGQEDELYISELKMKTKLPIIKAYRLSARDNSELALDQIIQSALSITEYVDAFLLDAPISSSTAKQPIDSEAYKLFCQKILKPTILAGGLNPQNIKQVLSEFKPQVIDLCSGVEVQPGKKSPDLVQQFLAELV